MKVQTPAERSYVVGLPVIVTVADDGTVSYEIDTTEAGQAVRENEHYDDVPQDVLDADGDLIDADHDRRV